MKTHKLVRDGDVVGVHTDGKPTKMRFNTDKVHDIRMFVQGGGLSEKDVDEKMKELSSTGETEFQDLKWSSPMLTSDRVFASFKNWKQSAVPVPVGCFFRGGVRLANVRVQMYGLVRIVDEPTIVVSCQDGSSVEMCRRDCQFESGEKAVADAPKELIVESGLAEMVQIDFPTGETCSDRVSSC